MVTSSNFTPSLVKLFEPVQTTDAARLVPDDAGDRDHLEVAVERGVDAAVLGEDRPPHGHP